MSEQNDSELSAAMSRILAYARDQMPESIICVMSFTQVEYDGVIYSANKIAVNAEDRESLVAMCADTLHNFLHAPVHHGRPN